MKEQHTPGPWEYSDMTGVSLADEPYAAFHIGVGNHLLFEFVEDYENHDKLEANVRLMTAAPRLLYALKNLLPLWQSGIDEPWVKEAKEAIAYAEGR